jgi:pyridoxine 5-phosphate synthase
MTRLSVNLNKVCLLRNSRVGSDPDPVAAAHMVIAAGCHGLTLHPRADARHATLDDVLAFGALEPVASGRIELNVEGDLRPELMRTAVAAGAHQFTVVPVIPGERTSSRGWRAYDDSKDLEAAVRFFAGRLRVSVFVDPTEASVRLAAAGGADAVEFYTGLYAAASHPAEAERHLADLVRATQVARELGLRVHAGHDLTVANLGPVIAGVAPEEVSIGHAIVGDALEIGLAGATRRFLDAIASAGSTQGQR